MSIAGNIDTDNPEIGSLIQELTGFAHNAVEHGLGMRDFERRLFDHLLVVGHQITEQFLNAQSDGDLGETCEVDGRTRYRSEDAPQRMLRTIFGEHQFDAFVYRVRKHPNSAIVMRPVDEQLGLTTQKYSPLLQEFSMMFCTEEAFLPGAEAFEIIFRQKLSVDTLERVSRMMGDEAADFLESLPTPAREEEGQLLVKTADGKGVPMVRRDAQRLRACDPRPDRPGNRRMATVACVYSVDRLFRSADEVIAALFSSHTSGQAASASRPQPRHKRYTASFGRWLPDLGEPVSGTCVAMSWANIEVESRHQPGQTLITIIDGQHSLWDAAAEQMGVPEEDNVEILDLLHVCSYVWKSAKIIHGKRNDQERFVKAKLNQILNGRVSGVIRSLRYLATAHRLPESKRDELERICGYFEAHADRMQYDVYLAQGYPIATGVIEGACRHIVKDRLERSGMRWSQAGAQGLLNLRCLRASGQWTEFHAQRCSPASSQNPLNA